MIGDAPDKILVDIIMVTFNQQDLVGKAIESVLCQETSFKYRLIIGDDCSTDKTYEICRTYADEYNDRIFLFKNSINLGLMRNYIKCFNLCSAEYIAILEGDDYWINNSKLEMQVTAFQKDSRIGLVHTDYKILHQESGKISKSPKINRDRGRELQGANLFLNLISSSWICAGTIMFKKNVLDQIDFAPFLKNECNTVDLIIELQALLMYEIKYLPEPTLIYRVSSTSISNSSSFKKAEKFADTKFFIRKFFLEWNNFPPSLIKKERKKKNSSLFIKAIKTKDMAGIKKYIGKTSFIGLFIYFQTVLLKKLYR